jgi:anti-anti-sigma factor
MGEQIPRHARCMAMGDDVRGATEPVGRAAVIHTSSGPGAPSDTRGVAAPADSEGRSPAYFQVIEDEGGELVISLRGEFDITSVGPLEATVVDLVVGAPGRLVFDLGGLEFMDPSGLAVLVSAAQKVPVRLRAVPPLLRRMIQVTGLARLLPGEP